MKVDYKKIIPSRKLRLKILRLLNFVPDELMLKIQYWIKTGNSLNLKEPQRFTEKLQWYKLFYKNPLLIQCVDKADVRDYVRSLSLDKILVDCYGIYNSPEEIDWDKLPESFVLKDTLGGGGNSVIIVKNKKQVDLTELSKKMSEWTSTKKEHKDAGREWPYYSGKKHRIIVEKYIESDDQAGGLIDYKFFCFNGKVEYLYVMTDRSMGQSVKLGIFDSEFNMLDVFRTDEERLLYRPQKPDNFSELRDTAEILANNFPEARIDLYNNDGEILFGEITFFDGSGYMKFEPDEFDYQLGEKFILPQPIK